MMIAAPVSVEPVKATPATRGSATAARRRSRRRPAGTAARRPARRLACSSRTAAAAMSGVCSAGLAITALPAASAAATWPVKIASGKFHGLMQTNTPRPCSVSSLLSPVGPGSARGAELGARARRVVAQEIDRLAHFGDGVGDASCPPRARDAHQLGHVRLEGIGRGLEHRARSRGRRRRPVRGARSARGERLVHQRGVASARCRRRRIGGGLVTGLAAAMRSRPSTIGAADGHRAPRPSLVARSAATTAPSARLSPRELARSGANSRRGGGCADAATRRQGVDLGDRIGDDHLGGRRFVDDAVDEGGVGAVLEQPAHQVRQQVLVLAHRRIDAARPIKPVRVATTCA